MSTEKNAGAVTPGGRPAWSEKIVLLRRELGITQVVLAQRLGIKQTSVSAWEIGTAKPSPANLIALAEMASDAELSGFFHKMAEQISGVKIADRRKGPSSVNVRGEARKGMVLIPLLKDSAAAGTPRMLDERNIDTELEIPVWMCPKAENCVALRVTGDSMSPTIQEGYIVLVDLKQKDPKKLINDMVAARDAEGGVTIKYLREVNGLYILMPEHTSQRHQPVVIDRNDDYAIVGKVVYFIGQPMRPKGRK